MGLAAKAFLTGFMKEAATSIKEENERLENYALTRANQLIKEMDEFEEEKKKFESEFDQQARDLTMYIQQANPNLSDREVKARVSGIIYKGQGKRVISMFESAENRLTAQMADVFKLDDEQLKSVSDNILEETKKQLSTGIKKPGGGFGAMPTTTAFGLPYDSEGALRDIATSRGKTPEEFVAKRLPRPEEIDTPLKSGRIDLSAFAAEPTLAEMKNSLVKTVIDPTASAADKKAATRRLGEIAAAEDILKKKDKDKEVKESDVRANLRLLDQDINREFVASGDLVRYTDPDTNQTTLEFANGIDPKVRNQIQARRREAFGAYIQEHYTQQGKVDPAVRRVAAAFLGSEPAAPSSAGAPAAADAAVPTRAEVRAEGNLFYVKDPESPGRLGPFKSRQEAIKVRDAYNKQKTQ